MCICLVFRNRIVNVIFEYKIVIYILECKICFIGFCGCSTGRDGWYGVTVGGGSLVFMTFYPYLHTFMCFLFKGLYDFIGT